MTYEEKIKRLEALVDQLERGECNLEESSKLFSEGIELVKSCKELLEQHKGTIVKIKQNFDNFTEEDFK